MIRSQSEISDFSTNQFSQVLKSNDNFQLNFFLDSISNLNISYTPSQGERSLKNDSSQPQIEAPMKQNSGKPKELQINTNIQNPNQSEKVPNSTRGFSSYVNQLMDQQMAVYPNSCSNQANSLSRPLQFALQNAINRAVNHTGNRDNSKINSRPDDEGKSNKNFDQENQDDRGCQFGNKNKNRFQAPPSTVSAPQNNPKSFENYIKNQSNGDAQNITIDEIKNRDQSPQSQRSPNFACTQSQVNQNLAVNEWQDSYKLIPINVEIYDDDNKRVIDSGKIIDERPHCEDDLSRNNFNNVQISASKDRLTESNDKPNDSKNQSQNKIVAAGSRPLPIPLQPRFLHSDQCQIYNSDTSPKVPNSLKGASEKSGNLKLMRNSKSNGDISQILKNQHDQSNASTLFYHSNSNSLIPLICLPTFSTIGPISKERIQDYISQKETIQFLKRIIVIELDSPQINQNSQTLSAQNNKSYNLDLTNNNSNENTHRFSSFPKQRNQSVNNIDTQYQQRINNKTHDPSSEQSELMSTKGKLQVPSLSQIPSKYFVEELLKQYSDVIEDHVINRELILDLHNKIQGLLSNKQKSEYVDLGLLQTITKQTGLLGLLLQGVKELNDDEITQISNNQAANQKQQQNISNIRNSCQKSMQFALQVKDTDVQNIMNVLQEFMESIYREMENQIYAQFNVQMRKMVLKYKETEKLIRIVNEQVNDNFDLFHHDAQRAQIIQVLEAEQQTFQQQVISQKNQIEKLNILLSGAQQEKEKMNDQIQKLNSQCDIYHSQLIESLKSVSGQVRVSPKNQLPQLSHNGFKEATTSTSNSIAVIKCKCENISQQNGIAASKTEISKKQYGFNPLQNQLNQNQAFQGVDKKKQSIQKHSSRKERKSDEDMVNLKSVSVSSSEGGNVEEFQNDVSVAPVKLFETNHNVTQFFQNLDQFSNQMNKSGSSSASLLGMVNLLLKSMKNSQNVSSASVIDLLPIDNNLNGNEKNQNGGTVSLNRKIYRPLIQLVPNFILDFYRVFIECIPVAMNPRKSGIQELCTYVEFFHQMTLLISEIKGISKQSERVRIFSSYISDLPAFDQFSYSILPENNAWKEACKNFVPSKPIQQKAYNICTDFQKNVQNLTKSNIENNNTYAYQIDMSRYAAGVCKTPTNNFRYNNENVNNTNQSLLTPASNNTPIKNQLEQQPANSQSIANSFIFTSHESNEQFIFLLQNTIELLEEQKTQRRDREYVEESKEMVGQNQISMTEAGIAYEKLKQSTRLYEQKNMLISNLSSVIEDTRAQSQIIHYITLLLISSANQMDDLTVYLKQILHDVTYDTRNQHFYDCREFLVENQIITILFNLLRKLEKQSVPLTIIILEILEGLKPANEISSTQYFQQMALPAHTFALLDLIQLNQNNPQILAKSLSLLRSFHHSSSMKGELSDQINQTIAQISKLQEMENLRIECNALKSLEPTSLPEQKTKRLFQ